MNDMMMNAAPQKKRKTWQWVILAVLFFFGSACACIGTCGAGLFGALTSSEPYKHGVQTATTHPQVIEALGEPIKPARLPQGNLNTTNGNGTAHFQTTLTGPKGEGTLYIDATKPAGGQWSYQRLEVVAGGETIPLQ